MTNSSDNDDQSLDSFDDILFSSGNPSDKEEVNASKTKNTEQVNFSSDESFDDILFGGAGDDKPSPAIQSENEEAVAVATTGITDDIVLEFSDDEPEEPPTPRRSAATKVTTPDNEIPELTPTAPSQAPKRSVSGTSVDEPVADDRFLEGALFSDDEEYIDDEIDNSSKNSTPEVAGEADDDAELMQDALFTNDEEFEQATDGHPSAVAEKKKVVIKSAVEKTESDSPPPINTDFQSFLSRASQADAFIAKTSSLQKQLIPENDAINDSFPLITTDPKQSLERPVLPTAESQQEESTGKVSFFAKKAKGNINEFLGSTIEDRTVALDFKFPRQLGKKEVGEAPTKREIQNYLDKKGAKTSTLLKRSEYDITLISKHNLSATERVRLLELFLPCFYEKVPQLITSFERKPFDPKNVERFEQLTLSLDSLKGLISGYKQIYTDFYEANNFNYKRKVDEANQCAYELVQLLYLEMRLMQASKISIPANSIKTINKIALVLRCYESNFFRAVQNHATQSSPKSVETLWKKYQLYLCFDHLAISSKLNQALDAYLDFYVLDKTDIINPDDVQYSSQSQLLFISDISDKKGKLLLLEDDSIEEAKNKTLALTSQGNIQIFFAVSDLFNQVKEDYQNCFLLLTGAQKKHSCESIDTLSKENTLCLFSYLNQQIETIEENNKKPYYSIYVPAELEIRTGIHDISDYYKALVDRWKLDLKGPQGGPENSSKEQFGHKGWSIANEDAECIYLQGTLQASTPYLDCGEVISISRKNEEGQVRHELAIIKELNLSNLHQPQLIASKIAQDITCLYSTAGFEPEHGREPMLKHPVLDDGVLCQFNRISYLLVSTDKQLMSEALLRVTLADNSNCIISTNQLHYISPTAMLFSLN